MDQNTFESRLRDEGFSQTVIVEREANDRLDLHTHPFEALALILAGEIRIDVDGESRLYRVGVICQGSCPVTQAAFFSFLSSCLTGLSHTVAGRSQFRVVPRQRPGLAALAFS